MVERLALAAQQVLGLEAEGTDVLVHHHSVERGARFRGLVHHDELDYSLRTTVRSQAMALTISELAHSASVGVETVRFYQRKGLLFDPKPAALGGAAGRRHYGKEEVRRLGFIRKAQGAGFTLEEIAELLELDRSNDRPRARAMAKSRITALDGRIAELQAARRSLEGLAKECARDEAGPCPIIAAFEGY